MNSFCFWSTTVGKKVVMAVTGIILTGFVVMHMIGNLQLFLGPAALNEYSKFLHVFLHGTGLWIARAVLVASVGLHIWAAIRLTQQSVASRPVPYHMIERRQSTYASRTMIWSGPILALFVIYHILHLTTGTVHGNFVEGDVYHNVITGFKVPAVSAFYILAMVALGLHMYHGTWSMLQTLGLSHPKWNPLRQGLSYGVTGAVVIGNIFMPIAVLAGIVR